MKKKVLLVEDDPASRFMMTEMLEDLGYQSVCAENGQMGVDAARDMAAEIGLILMDIHMPVKSGDEAIGEIRRMESDPPRSVPVFAVSADHVWQDKVRASAHGFNGTVSKPVRLAALREVLDEVFRGGAQFA